LDCAESLTLSTTFFLQKKGAAPSSGWAALLDKEGRSEVKQLYRLDDDYAA
jgi:hypothetical protein